MHSGLSYPQTSSSASVYREHIPPWLCNVMSYGSWPLRGLGTSSIRCVGVYYAVRLSVLGSEVLCGQENMQFVVVLELVSVQKILD